MTKGTIHGLPGPQLRSTVVCVTYALSIGIYDRFHSDRCTEVCLTHCNYGIMSDTLPGYACGYPPYAPGYTPPVIKDSGTLNTVFT